MNSSGRHQVLFIDDDRFTRYALERSLTPALADRYELSFVASGAEAAVVLAGQPVDIVVADQHMPDELGTDVLRAVSNQYPNGIRIILSSLSDAKSFADAILVAHDILPKPVSYTHLTLPTICSV